MAAADALMNQGAANAFGYGAAQASKMTYSAWSANVTNAKGEREFLFCIPVQVGPPTPKAKNVLSWLHMILLVQVIVLILRIVVLWDFTGALWMMLVIGLGIYAVYQDLNITYVCCWGLACALHGTVEVIGLILPYIIPVFPTLNFVQTLIRATIPLVYLTGALLARHLYHDYAISQGLPTTLLSSFDPLGHYVETHDPEKQMPTLAHAADHFVESAPGVAIAAANKAQDVATDAAAQGIAHAAQAQVSSLDAAKANLLTSITSGQQTAADAATAAQPGVDAAKANVQLGLDAAAQNANAAAAAADVLSQQAAQNAAAKQAGAEAAARALLAQGNTQAQAAKAAAEGAFTSIETKK